MHLQKQLSRIVENKEYPKYVLIIPPSTIEELEWKEGEELDHEIKDDTLVIRKAKQVNEAAMRIAAKHARVKRGS